MLPVYKEKLIDEMRQIQQIKKKRTSKLEPFKAEILTLRQFNLSYKKIAKWIFNEYGVKTSSRQVYNMITTSWKNDPLIKKIKKGASK